MSKKLWQKALISAFPLINNLEVQILDQLREELSDKKFIANVLSDEDGKIIVQIQKITDNIIYSLIYNPQSKEIYFSRKTLLPENAKYCFFALALAASWLEKENFAFPLRYFTDLQDGDDKNVPWIPFLEKDYMYITKGELTFERGYSDEIKNVPVGKIVDFKSDLTASFIMDTQIIEDEYRIRKDNYNSIEQERIDNNTLVDGFLPTVEDNACVKRIYNWITKKGYAPSFFFYGPAGTGKSEVGKYFSKITGIPYTFVTCSAMTNEADLRGKPNKLSQNGAIIKFCNRLVKNFWNRTIETSDIDSDEIQYSNTELVLACKYGWIIEIQEAAHIIDAGTLGFLNCTLDTNRVLTLPNGEQIKLHPNTTFIFTSNVEYEGCNPFNLSLLSRMCYTRRFDAMSINDQIDRVMSVTNYKNRDDVRKVIQAIRELNNIIADNDITQGICDMRSAINCITDYQLCGGSLRDSARLTIEDKVSLESGYEEEIRLKLDSILGIV